MKLLFVLLFFIQSNFYPQSDSIDCSSLQSGCFSVEKMPAIIGGLDSLHLRLIYPTEAIKYKIEGEVYVLVTIDSLGNPFCAKIIIGIGYGCDEEALRLVNSSKYTAGEQRGKPVVITMSIPIVFKIDDNF